MHEDAVLLDTHVWLWLEGGSDRLDESPVLPLIRKALEKNCAFVSIMSIWELGMLESKGRLRLQQDINQWIEKALAVPGIRLHALSTSIAIESTRLPGEFHSDPMDRILVATARELNAPIMTADAAILAYANRDYVKAVEA
ncbi:MAG TPA: type II toxin-antitoxin system VapC family toxin [Fibrobacteria bacterium]|nr:type II toxin-antitoxin system VapC family toxin [Fibrobacteria bacterium]